MTFVSSEKINIDMAGLTVNKLRLANNYSDKISLVICFLWIGMSSPIFTLSGKK